MEEQRNPSGDRSTPMDHRTDEDSRRKVVDMARKARIAMMATFDAKGMPHARPMAAVAYEDPDEGTALWFFTRAESRKLDELRADPRVMLNYSDESSDNWLSINGRAEVLRDRQKAKELWQEPLRTWFPEGPEDDAVALIKVIPEEAEYWDSPSGVTVMAVGYAKALLTGEPPKPGDVAHVRM
ncbi:MAG: pyridoxamine 5'-phosphate oxidase family protein [Hasllibacter sp.]